MQWMSQHKVVLEVSPNTPKTLWNPSQPSLQTAPNHPTLGSDREPYLSARMYSSRGSESCPQSLASESSR